MRLQGKDPVHLLGNRFQLGGASAFDFGRDPAVVIDFDKGFANVLEIEIAFADLSERVLSSGKTLHVELLDAFSELAYPIAHGAVLPVIAYI